jgi:predicted CopG family antitoxin
MVKTIRVSEDYHTWLSSHKRPDETMGETIRRLTHAPPPAEPILTDDQAEEMQEAISRLRESDRNRRSRVAETLEEADIDR